MGLFIFYFFLTVLLSFICSLLEAVLLSVPISYVNMKEAEGAKTASMLRKYKEQIDRPLAAILTVNTIANTVGAALVGFQAVELWGNVYLGIASGVLTLFLLIFSEIIPKTIGAKYDRALALKMAYPLQVCIFLTYPFVLMSNVIAKQFGKNKHEATVSREEVSAIVDIATNEGEFKVKESKIIQNLMKLESVKVEDIMTPQIVVSIAPENMTVADFHKNKDYLHFSRIPVYEDENEDNITGYVLRRTILENLANDNFNLQLKEIRRNIVIAKEGLSITTLWETLLEEKEHIALVIDEYGSFAGIVTLEDIIESILGLEIVDEADVEEDMQQYARKKWEERREKYKHIVSEAKI